MDDLPDPGEFAEEKTFAAAAHREDDRIAVRREDKRAVDPTADEIGEVRVLIHIAGNDERAAAGILHRLLDGP